MGALAPVTPWIAKDDLLLKNAVEAGASLESLAKGAVQFSRRFTKKELQDRWYYLLYDPHISAEASAQMIEFERSARKLLSKSTRPVSSKDDKCGHGKRKAISIRSSFKNYALRKRICSEPLNLGDSYNLSGSGAPGVNGMLEDPIAIHFGLQDTSFDDLEVFSQVLRNSAPLCGVDEFPIEQPSTLEDSIEQNNARKEIPLENNLEGNCRRFGPMHPSKELPGDHSIFQAIEANPVANSRDIMSSDFGGNTILNSPVPGCETSFHHMHYTSPLPEIPDWKEFECISRQGMPDDVNIKGNNVLTGDPFSLPDDGGTDKEASDYNIIRLERNPMPCGVMKNSTDCTDGYFVELTDALFDFTDEEILEDAIDKAYLDGLSSLLLNSPYDANDDEMPKMPELKEPAAPVAYPDIPTNTVPEEKSSAGESHLGDIHKCTSDTQVPTAASTVGPEFLKDCNGVICCTLNTEDLEIPCNDHVVFPSKPRPASTHKRTQNETTNPALHGKDDISNQVRLKVVGTSKREPKHFGGSNPASQPRGAEMQLSHTVDEFGIKFETSRVELVNCSENPCSGAKGPCHSGLAVKKEPSELQLVRQSGSSGAYKACHVSDSGHLPSIVGGINQEGHALPTVRNQGLYDADLMDTEPRAEPLLSDQSEEQFSDSDEDIPCFSDVESMILNMDLSPDDQDSFWSREVAKYQHEDTMRKIIRLEQNFDSCTRRPSASRGAFAVLYGLHSKHYIKKPEVLLGRATDGVGVDIDLGREGRANFISRRQAIIKMDKDGAFYMKNLGKRSIYMNGEEVIPGDCIRLHSSCTIAIRGVWFNFETNQACVKRYLSNIARKYGSKGLGFL